LIFAANVIRNQVEIGSSQAKISLGTTKYLLNELESLKIDLDRVK